MKTGAVRGLDEVLLIADRNAEVRVAVRSLVRPNRCRIAEAADGSSVLRLAQECRLRAVVLGELEGGFGRSLDLIRCLRKANQRPAVFLYPECSSEEAVIAALRERVEDYFARPDLAGLAAAVNRQLNDDAGEAAWCMVGSSEKMRAVRRYLDKLARADCPVLITGETGTGKELAARTIHESSTRAAAPFVAINCAAIPDALFESEMFGSERGAFTGAVTRREGKLVEASGGTVLLDEIGEMPLLAQAKLLRTIETKQVVRLGGSAGVPLNLRFLAATNRPLEDMVKNGTFRADLFFRLAVTRVELPPLRQRREDIAELAAHFISDLNRRMRGQIEGFTGAALSRLACHDWPGNVRELKNLMEALAVETDRGTIGEESFPAWFGGGVADVGVDERTAIVAALEELRWNKSKAAAKLRWSRMTLYRKLAQHKIAAS